MKNKTGELKQKIVKNGILYFCLLNLSIFGLFLVSNGSVSPSVNVVPSPTPPVITGGLENGVFNKEDSILIQGDAHIPDALVTIYIFSPHPMIVTATSDDQGRFAYLLAQRLGPGEHEVWAQVTNDKGITSKESNPVIFTIKGEIISQTETESIDGPLTSLFSRGKSIWNNLITQIVVSCLLLLAIGTNIYFIFREVRKNKLLDLRNKSQEEG